MGVRRYLAVVCCFLLLAFLFLSPPDARAESEYHAVEVKNVRFATGDGKVHVTWEAHVVKGGPALGPDRITIKRSEHYGSFVGDPVAVLEMPQSEGWLSMSWTDGNVEVGKTYHYKVNSKDYWNAVTVRKDSVPPSLGGQETSPWSPGGDIKDEGGLFERAVASVFDGLYKVFTKLTGKFGFKPVGELVLQVDDNAYDLVAPAPFSPEQWRTLDGLYGGMASVGLALYLIAVLVAAGRFIGAGISKNPEARAEASSQLWRMFFALIIIAGAPVVVRTLYVLNNALVEAIRTAAGDGGRLSEILSNDWLAKLQTGSVLGTAIVKVVFAWAGFWINIIFWVRDWVVSVLYVFTPVMALLWVMNRNVTAASVWLGELLSNTFLQSAYALAAVVIVVFIANGNIGWPQKVLGAYMIITLGGLLRNGLQGLWTRWAGIEEEGVAAKALGMFGLGGVAGLGRLVVGSIAAPSVAGAPGGTGGIGASGGSTINLQGTAAPSGTAGSTGTSPGAGAATGGPPGYTVSPGGLLVPASQSAAPAGTASGSGVQAAAGPQLATAGGGLPTYQNPLIRSMDYGRVTRNVVQGVVSTVGAAGAAVMPGGDRVLRAVAKGAGIAAQVAATAGGLMHHSYQRARQGGGGAVETVRRLPGAALQTLKDGTNVQQGGVYGAAKATFKAATAATIDAVSPNSTPVVAKRLTGSSLDGYRFKS
ncbi:hypothetical protein [Desulfofundulus salinus]|uniref:Uncharacterized protein n=1 Tax=Desulfofundulus salinus TaxID=2419843 RepID=A0A494WUB5_9FIRM|nr:hypothetical protein [Desulfofundulus salinum]RKO65692.1 hypothetical protein D7024_01050 [Desulfofundulus salinum]